MNAVKEKAAEVGELIRELGENKDLDQRWVAIAKTDLQKGFAMERVAAIKPDFF